MTQDKSDSEHSTYGERYRFCSRQLLRIVHAMGDPETPVRSLDVLVASGDPEGIMESYIDALLTSFEAGPTVDHSPCGKWWRIRSRGRYTPWCQSEKLAWEHFERPDSI